LTTTWRVLASYGYAEASSQEAYVLLGKSPGPCLNPFKWAGYAVLCVVSGTFRLALLTPVILAKFMDLVVIAKVAMVAVFPNVAGVGVEERVVTAAV